MPTSPPATDLAERLRVALSSPAVDPPVEGDLPELRAQAAVPAAVLIAITDRAEPGLILTVRREHMRTHAGQIAFPGGRIDDGEDPYRRGLARGARGAAFSTRHPSKSSALSINIALSPAIVVTPVIGVIPPDPPLTPHEHEVAEWFEAPLAHLLDPASQHRRTALFQGRERHYYEILWNERRIWGATAAIIVNLSRRLQWS